MTQKPMIELEQPSKVNRIGYKIMYVFMILLAVSVGVFLRWTFQSEEVLTIKNAPVPVRTIRKHPTADGIVILKVDYCKNISARGEVRTSFVSQSREIFLPKGIDNQPPQCMNTEVPVIIPHDTPPDTYKVKFYIDYDVNPLKQDLHYEFESSEFKIIK